MTNDASLTGYAQIVAHALMPLNGNAAFRRRYANVKRSFILNSPHWSKVAVVVVDHGSLQVLGLGKKPAAEFTDTVEAADAYLEMGTDTFLAFAMKRLSVAGVLKLWLGCAVRMRKPWRLITLYRLYRLTSGVASRQGIGSLF